MAPPQRPTRGLVTRFMSSSSETESAEVQEVRGAIKSAGDVVREKKAAGEDVQAEVATLKELKAQFEALTGTPFDPPKASKSKSGQKQQQKGGGGKKKQQQQQQKGGDGGSDQITPRAEDYSKWYNDVVFASDLIAQSPVRGCMVIKPWGMALWDNLRDDLDRRIK